MVLVLVLENMSPLYPQKILDRTFAYIYSFKIGYEDIIGYINISGHGSDFVKTVLFPLSPHKNWAAIFLALIFPF